MTAIDLADDTFVVAPPKVLAKRLGEQAFWRTCWPQVSLDSYQDRGVEGRRWYVTGEVAGSAELWLEPYGDGTIVHIFLRADPPPDKAKRRRIDALRRRYTIALKDAVFSLKLELEAGRPPGVGRKV
jgi:hypothetical protein